MASWLLFYSKEPQNRTGLLARSCPLHLGRARVTPSRVPDALPKRRSGRQGTGGGRWAPPRAAKAPPAKAPVTAFASRDGARSSDFIQFPPPPPSRPDPPFVRDRPVGGSPNGNAGPGHTGKGFRRGPDRLSCKGIGPVRARAGTIPDADQALIDPPGVRLPA